MFRLSALEAARFGVRTVRADISKPPEISALLTYCSDAMAQLCIVRVPVDAVTTAQQLESAGFRIMDTHVTYERFADPGAVAESVPIRPADDSIEVEAIARECFRGYVNHYSADPRLDPEACDAIYPDWARRSCEARSATHEVFIAYDDRDAVGFLSVEIEDHVARVPLNAVLPDYRRKGVYTALLKRALAWSAEHGAARLRISTQLSNLAVQSAWAKLGFRLVLAEYTFHKWMDE